MGKYLDNWLNRCTRNTTTCPNGSTTSVPNENYARELLQLFTLGLWELNQNGTVRLNATGQPIPTYNQATLVEYARALTGWTYARTNGADNYLLDDGAGHDDGHHARAALSRPRARRPC